MKKNSKKIIFSLYPQDPEPDQLSVFGSDPDPDPLRNITDPKHWSYQGFRRHKIYLSKLNIEDSGILLKGQTVEPDTYVTAHVYSAAV